MSCWIPIAVCLLTAQSPEAGVVIEGLVVNGSRGQAPVAGATVVLRAQYQGDLVPVAQATSDHEGRFRFERLKLDENLVCLPGANFQGIHYPGQRLTIHPRRPLAPQKIVVYETLAEPSPLIAVRHDIELRPEPGVLVATETIIMANNSLQSYVGSETPDGQATATLRLSIPTEFEKVTFAKEFFGRQFQINKERLETTIPWTPGRKELKFTYRLPLTHRYWLFHRPLDMPTEQLRVIVSGQHGEDAVCNLPQTRALPDGSIVFESTDGVLPKGHLIELQFGDLPVAWTAYARWCALAALVGLVIATSVVLFLRKPPQAAAKRTERKPRKPARASSGGF
jgi:hypothetical protein